MARIEHSKNERGRKLMQSFLFGSETAWRQLFCPSRTGFFLGWLAGLGTAAAVTRGSLSDAELTDIGVRTFSYYTPESLKTAAGGPETKRGGRAALGVVLVCHLELTETGARSRAASKARQRQAACKAGHERGRYGRSYGLEENDGARQAGQSGVVALVTLARQQSKQASRKGRRASKPRERQEKEAERQGSSRADERRVHTPYV